MRETYAEVVFFQPEGGVYVTEILFPRGDEQFEQWLAHPFSKRYQTFDTEVGQGYPNCWVLYVNEQDRIQQFKFKFESESEGKAWFQHINNIAHVATRGRPKSFENQRKTWKEAQNKVKQTTPASYHKI
jgi:hypothetical protein